MINSVIILHFATLSIDVFINSLNSRFGSVSGLCFREAFLRVRPERRWAGYDFRIAGKSIIKLLVMSSITFLCQIPAPLFSYIPYRKGTSCFWKTPITLRGLTKNSRNVVIGTLSDRSPSPLAGLSRANTLTQDTSKYSY